MKICVLASSGVESSALLYLASQKYKEVFPLYVSHGYIWEKAERYWLKKFIKNLRSKAIQPLSVIRYPVKEVLGNHWSLSGSLVPSASSDDKAVYLPGRNVLLLSLAAAFSFPKKIPKIAIGILHSNPFPDSTPEFFRCMENTLRQGYKFAFQIERPFSKLKKTDVIDLVKDKIPLPFTFSCLKPRGQSHCGRCNKCAERQKAFKDTGPGPVGTG